MVLAAALACLGLICCFKALAREAPAPVAVSARLVEEGATARLTFDLSSAIDAHAFALAEPNRIVVDIPEVNFQIDPSVGRPQGHGADAIVKMFRFGLFGPGKSRIVIDLLGQARIDRVWVRPIAAGAPAARLEIDLSGCDAGTFARSVRANAPAAALAADEAAPASSTADLPVVVLDPGHGGIDGGAEGPAGEIEKKIVYDFTIELARKLDALKKFKVVLTRNGDEFVSLGNRVKIARDANAALLISIHADTLADAAGVSGATVYTLSDRASDAVAARVAESENAADNAAGLEQKEESAGVADILFDLKRRETRTYAHMFSRGVVEEWKSAGRLNRNPERSAGFVVLKAPDFPSVLIELGYLSSRQDVKSMTSPEWRVKATSALANAVVRFFSPPAKVDKAEQDNVSVVDPASKNGESAR
jgi:N-acetylmuramoyl-L-alanine amidase